MYAINEGVQHRVELLPRVLMVATIVVGVQGDDSEPTRGDRLEDVSDKMDAVHLKLKFLERVNVGQIDAPDEV